jgi:hypothetical protein
MKDKLPYKVGDIVNYHAEIGGAVTSKGHVIQHIDKLKSGHDVAWISHKSGCVAISALSKNAYYCCNAEFGEHEDMCVNKGRKER